MNKEGLVGVIKNAEMKPDPTYDRLCAFLDAFADDAVAAAIMQNEKVLPSTLRDNKRFAEATEKVAAALRERAEE